MNFEERNPRTVKHGDYLWKSPVVLIIQGLLLGCLPIVLVVGFIISMYISLR